MPSVSHSHDPQLSTPGTILYPEHVATTLSEHSCGAFVVWYTALCLPSSGAPAASCTPPCSPAPHCRCCAVLCVSCLSVPALRAEVPLNELSHIIVTHLGPNRFPTLKVVLEEALQGRTAGNPLKLVVTNPAKAALQKGLAGAARTFT